MIVCGTDLSERSRPAKMAAAALGQRLGETELYLVYVLDLPTALLPDSLVQQLARATADELDRQASELRQTTSLAVHSRLIDTAGRSVRPAHALVDFAEAEGASLLVVSSQGHGSSPLFKLGGTSERLAQVTKVPVIVVRDATPFVDWASGGRPLRVVIGVDESRTSDSAVRFAQKLRSRGPLELTVAHVYYVNDAVRRYGLTRKIAQIDEDPELQGLIERDLQARFALGEGEGRTTYRAKLGLGRLGDHLLSVAEAEAADLVVVGTHQGRGISRLSSVSSVVLHHAHASVACIPQSDTFRMVGEPPALKRILVSTDLSPEGNLAASYAYSLCGAQEGEVHLLHVAPETEAHPRSEAEIAQELRHLVPKPSFDAVTRTLVVRRKDVARAICETAERVGADVVCLAASSKSVVDRTLVGSVATQVLQQASRPVLLIRAPQP